MKPSLNPVSSYVQLASAGIVKYHFPESAIMRFRELKRHDLAYMNEYRHKPHLTPARSNYFREKGDFWVLSSPGKP